MKMATVYAGVKRSFYQMQDRERPSASPCPTSALVSRQGSLSGEASGALHLSTTADATRPRKVSFNADASVVLIGVRGVGKSSLGVLAATAYSRRLIESERAFFEATGSTPQDYRKHYGTVPYHTKHPQILKRTLETHSKNCIIVCSFSDLENDGAVIIRDYAQNHPVIHVTRDAWGIQSHFRDWTEDRVKQLLCASGPILRSCGNFEFFNLSEKPQTLSQRSRRQSLATAAETRLRRTIRRSLMDIS